MNRCQQLIPLLPRFSATRLSKPRISRPRSRGRCRRQLRSSCLNNTIMFALSFVCGYLPAGLTPLRLPIAKYSTCVSCFALRTMAEVDVVVTSSGSFSRSGLSPRFHCMENVRYFSVRTTKFEKVLNWLLIFKVHVLHGSPVPHNRLHTDVRSVAVNVLNRVRLESRHSPPPKPYSHVTNVLWVFSVRWHYFAKNCAAGVYYSFK